MESLARVLDRIREALAVADRVLERHVPGEIAALIKSAGDPVTEADLEVDRALREVLPRGDEGWLSEETVDRPERFDRSSLWIVDPIDGTREFVQGIPEWCVSVGYVRNGEAMAGGILNRASAETFLGAVGIGMTLNDEDVRVRWSAGLDGATVLASRSEVRRGEWARHESAPFTVQPVGSVAYKLALVAAGRADATWTLVPKNEWDVAAGVALIRAAGGEVRTAAWSRPRFNQRTTSRLDGLVAAGPCLIEEVGRYLHLTDTRSSR